MPSRRELANAIRALSMDAVQRANSGHPGMPMGMADIAEVLWRDFLKHDPGHKGTFIISLGPGEDYAAFDPGTLVATVVQTVSPWSKEAARHARRPRISAA